MVSWNWKWADHGTDPGPQRKPEYVTYLLGFPNYCWFSLIKWFVHLEDFIISFYSLYRTSKKHWNPSGSLHLFCGNSSFGEHFLPYRKFWVWPLVSQSQAKTKVQVLYVNSHMWMFRKAILKHPFVLKYAYNKFWPFLSSPVSLCSCSVAEPTLVQKPIYTLMCSFDPLNATRVSWTWVVCCYLMVCAYLAETTLLKKMTSLPQNPITVLDPQWGLWIHLWFCIVKTAE